MSDSQIGILVIILGLVMALVFFIGYTLGGNDDR